MTHRVITPPTSLPVDMSLVLAHLLMDSDASESTMQLLELYVGGAVTHIEETCEHALSRQTWAIDLGAWPRSIDLPGGNVQRVDEVSYVDGSGVRRVIPADAYLTRTGLSGNVRPLYGANWPSARSEDAGIEVVYEVGYEVGAVPKPLQQAILLLVGDFDANKGTKVEGQWAESPTVKRLLWPYRKLSA